MAIGVGVAGRTVPVGARIVAHLVHDGAERPPLPSILWQDGDLFACDKPPGLHVNETETSSSPSVVSVFEGRGLPRSPLGSGHVGRTLAREDRKRGGGSFSPFRGTGGRKGLLGHYERAPEPRADRSGHRHGPAASPGSGGSQ